MPRDGAIIFGDLIGKLDDLRVSCDKCGRSGRYQVQRLIRDRGRETKIVDWLDQITDGLSEEVSTQLLGKEVARGLSRPARQAFY